MLRLFCEKHLMKPLNIIFVLCEYHGPRLSFHICGILGSLHCVASDEFRSGTQPRDVGRPP